MAKITIPSLTRTHSGKALALIVVLVGAAPAGRSGDGRAEPSLEWRHLYTFGSPHGIHPPRVLNRKLARAALGNPENPYGLLHPVAAAADSRRRVWITDSGTGSVHIFDTAGGGYQEIRSAGDVRLQRPAGIAMDGQGRTYLGDMGTGAIFVFDDQGKYDHTLTKRGRSLVEGPYALALSDDNRTIYAADFPRNRIVELNREGDIDGIIDLPKELSGPSAITVAHNQIYVLGSVTHRVGIFNPGGLQRGELQWKDIPVPAALAFNPISRQFLVANPRWMAVQVFDEAGRNLSLFGQRGDGLDQMQSIDSLYIDPEGRVFIVDSREGKVLVFSQQ